MDSRDLLEGGFSKIENPKNWSALPEKPRIYALYVSKSLERLEGEANIIYLGETGDIQRRMKEYYEPNGWIKDRGTGHRINSKIQRYDKEVYVLSKQAPESAEDRKEEEQKLIRTFLDDHHELPAWNRSTNKKYFPWT